jgi:hypothetical protein
MKIFRPKRDTARGGWSWLFNDVVSVDDRMFNEYGAVAGIRTGIGNRSIERKPGHSAT